MKDIFTESLFPPYRAVKISVALVLKASLNQYNRKTLPGNFSLFNDLSFIYLFDFPVNAGLTGCLFNGWSMSTI